MLVTNWKKSKQVKNGNLKFKFLLTRLKMRAGGALCHDHYTLSSFGTPIAVLAYTSANFCVRHW